MALVPCPECKARVSRSATSCPQCGFPFGGATAVATPLVTARPSSPAGEEVLWEGAPSLKALAVTMVATALFAIAVPVAVYLAYAPARHFLTHASPDARKLVVQHEEQARLIIMVAVAALVGSRALRLGWRMLALRSHRYRVSSQRITVESGVLSKTLAEVDVRTIDDITFRQTLVERLLGIGQITIVSSEPATPRLALLGVPNPREVRELVRGSAYAATRNQLFTRST
jgi:hypothetical protein